MFKKCPKCPKPKLISEFSKSNCSNDGLQCFCKEHNKQHYEENKKEILTKMGEYYKENKEEKLEYQNKYYEENKKDRKKYYDKNKEKIAKHRKDYRDKNREKLAFYQRNKRQTDIGFKIACNLRNRMYNALKRKDKVLSTMFLIGCDVDYLMYYLQERFTKGMSWDNYGDWHIDHIKPCAKFNLSKPEEQQKCFHYSNLQPLWAIDNHKKSDK